MRATLRTLTTAALGLSLCAPLTALAGEPGRAVAEAGHLLRLREERIAAIEAPLEGVSPGERARRATEALAAAYAAGARLASVKGAGEAALVLLGDRTIVAVGPADALASGAPDVSAAAGSMAAAIERAVREEDRKLAAQSAVFSVSMLVFSALVAFLLARRVGALAVSWAERVEAGELEVSAPTAAGVELASTGFVRAAVPLGLRLARIVAWLAALYAWLVFAASLSERTRPLGDRLEKALLDPVTSLLGAVGRSIPLVIGLAVGGVLLGIVLRATRLWFEAIARGDATSPWVTREHARSTGALVRAAILVLALLAAPEVLGLGERGVGGVGLAALAALALGASPIAATLLLGVLAVYGGRVRPGDVAEVAGRRGRVLEVTFREIVLEDGQGGLVHVPHLLSLVHPIRVERRG